MHILLIVIGLPIATGLAILSIPARTKGLREVLSILGMAANLVLVSTFFGKDIYLTLPWAGGGIDLSFRLYSFNSFILIAAAALGFLITLYSASSMYGKGYSRLFLAYILISFGLVNGALLSDNLIAMLFFWEGLLLTLFAMIAVGNKNAFRTATKAFIIVGVCDLVMMVGIALAGHISGTLSMSKMAVPMTGMGGLAFLFMMIGAISKAGSMPFHSWIPDAAIDAPLPFMALLPGALEKLMGIYFLTRISLDIFKLEMHSWASTLMMTVGAITILVAVLMALVQKNYKKLLSYHAISQVGYMVLGIGTMTPVGIVGGLFHMINNAMYKSCLFLTGGAVEKEAGTTDLDKLGGLGLKMPITFACFIITALSISGVPPFNGFFSKELVYDGALERGRIFYFAAVLGSFFTAASFLKLGHAAFLGKLDSRNSKVKEASWYMLIPMILIALSCVVFGIYNGLPIDRIIRPALGNAIHGGHSFAGFPKNMALVAGTVVVLIAALLNHLYGVKKTGKGLGAVDHIHNVPGLSWIYDKAERGYFDPYNIGRILVKAAALILSSLDKIIDFFFSNVVVWAADTTGLVIRKMHNGSHKMYIMWSLVATVIVIIFLMRTM
ncbi:MAG: proton-conducting transporter membrane subunit [Candidatus Omnitrophica bacterium]|nr:proton-conducting transporter membrane subunit [Candidatus Omnitrophota bacterium]